MIKDFFKIINVASKTTLLRSAPQFAHTCASVGELPHFLIIEGAEIMRQEGNALKVVGFIFRPKKKKSTRKDIYV